MAGSLAKDSRETGVSFVVTVYNKAPWLTEVCSHIAAQRGNFAREYIFIDDGSTDNSLAIIEEATAGWGNVTIHHQANAGVPAATNTGISLARLPFIKLVDADDLLHADATRHLLEALQSVPEAVVAYGQAEFYDTLQTIDPMGQLPQPKPEIIHDPTWRSIRNTLFNPSMALVRREAALQVGGCDERLRAAQDLTLALRVSLLGPFVSISEPVAFIPRDVPDRVGASQGRQLQRINQALALFLEDHPELPWRLKQFACRRAAGRAWKYVHRTTKANGLTSRYFWNHIRSRLPIIGGHGDFIRKCAASFDLEGAAQADTGPYRKCR